MSHDWNAFLIIPKWTKFTLSKNCFDLIQLLDLNHFKFYWVPDDEMETPENIFRDAVSDFK